MLKFKPGMKVVWNAGNVGCVIDLYPKDRLLVWAVRLGNWVCQEVMLNISEFDAWKKNGVYEISEVVPGSGYRAIKDDELIVAKDEVFTADGWIRAPLGYAGDRVPYLFRRKINA